MGEVEQKGGKKRKLHQQICKSNNRNAFLNTSVCARVSVDEDGLLKWCVVQQVRGFLPQRDTNESNQMRRRKQR